MAKLLNRVSRALAGNGGAQLASLLLTTTHISQGGTT